MRLWQRIGISGWLVSLGNGEGSGSDRIRLPTPFAGGPSIALAVRWPAAEWLAGTTGGRSETAGAAAVFAVACRAGLGERVVRGRGRLPILFQHRLVQGDGRFAKLSR